MSFIEQLKRERCDQYGRSMEQIACDYLKIKGYKILEQNYQNMIGEIDIIALDKTTKRIVFVEVKARKNLKYGFGREAVNSQKLAKIAKTANYYLKDNKKLNQSIRFDVIEIMGNEVYHLVAVQ